MKVQNFKALLKLSPSQRLEVKTIDFKLFADRKKAIPDAVFDCINLEKLVFYRMDKLELGPSIARLTKLKTLSISYCTIQTLPTEIQTLDSLQELILDETTMTELPDCVYGLKNLEKLDLIRGAFRQLSPKIAQLKNLKKLLLQRSLLSSLPSEISTLKNLEQLSFNNTEIEGMPVWLGDLKQLKLLSTSPCTFDDVPYFLFKLKKLAYYSIPFFSIKGLSETVAGQLRKYLRKHASEGCVQAYIDLVDPTRAPKNIALKHYIEACNTDDKGTVGEAIVHLRKHCPNTLESHPLKAGSTVTFLGKFNGLDEVYIQKQLEAQSIASDTKVNDSTTHVVLCYENKRKFDPAKYPNIVFISNYEMIDWMKKHEGAGYLDDHADNKELQDSIRDLLLANNTESIQTALEMLKSGGISKSMTLPLLLAYSTISNQTEVGKNTRADIRETLYRSPLSESAKNTIKSGLSKAGFSFHPKQDGDERLFKKRLERKGHKEFEMVEMAKYYFKTERAAYVFLFESDLVSKEEKIAFVKTNFLKGNKLDFSGLSELNKVPEIVHEFKNIEAVDLRNCAFGRFPMVLRDGVFKQLKEIDLRKNPLAAIPKNAAKKLAGCNILI